MKRSPPRPASRRLADAALEDALANVLVRRNVAEEAFDIACRAALATFVELRDAGDRRQHLTLLRPEFGSGRERLRIVHAIAAILPIADRAQAQLLRRGRI